MPATPVAAAPDTLAVAPPAGVAWDEAPLLSSDEFRAARAHARDILGRGWPGKLKPLLGRLARTCALVAFLFAAPVVPLEGNPGLASLAAAVADDEETGWIVRGRALGQSLLLLAEEPAASVGQRNRSRLLRQQLNQAAARGLVASPVAPADREALLDAVWDDFVGRTDEGAPAVRMPAAQRTRILTEPAVWVAVHDADGAPVTVGAALTGDGSLARWDFCITVPGHPLRKQSRFFAHRALTDQLRAAGAHAVLSGSALHLNEGLVNFQRVFGYRMCSVRI
jgi:hypothetical protein